MNEPTRKIGMLMWYFIISKIMFGGMIMFLKYLSILEGRIKNIYQ